MTTITKRVSGTITEGKTKRVDYFGATDITPGTLANDTWGGTWGGVGTKGLTWGKAWFTGGPEVPAIPAAPAVDVAQRVSGDITENTTKRVTGV